MILRLRDNPFDQPRGGVGAANSSAQGIVEYELQLQFRDSHQLGAIDATVGKTQAQVYKAAAQLLSSAYTRLDGSQ